MIIHKALRRSAMLILVLAAFPAAALAQAHDGPRPGANPAAPNEGKKSRDELEQELARLRSDTAGSLRAAQKAIEALQEEVARLRKEVEGLRQQPVTRSAQFTPPSAPPGQIRLVNTYDEPVTVIVNGTPYRLASGETRLLRGQLPGPFTYEVVGVRPPVSRVLAPNQTFRIHVFPTTGE
jgi:hypothetical protein